MTFADLSIHPALRTALAARGYETPTGVQAAVLDAASAGRDLLVSSQTGSGKTIAFGAAMADSLLPADDAHVPHGPSPIALVIVPTRELAVQVREELRWLFADTGLRLASCTGGTPVMGDLKALQRGVELVIGTPGRLVDLLRRQRLQLANLRVVVLDEADEMLDLGFREDLEKLLQAAPAERRTLLLSATLPSEIRALARRYQREAIAIDPRKGEGAGAGAGPGKGGHEDITHRAHLIAGGDRLAAVVNVLRGEETTTRAIVFCTTREGVAEMHAALVARGFSATAISGDRAQAERDRALEQLRRGDAQVLVATNVAARGLHLPDVDLIVHADLPLNADSLIHRSGRTGRAGRKGTAVVIATAFERRKAERLFGAAQVKVEWTPPPSSETIAAAARARLADELVAEEPAAEEPAAETTAAADDLLARVEDKLPARELLRRLLARELARLPVGEPVRPVNIAGPGSGNRGGGYQDLGPPGRKGSHRDFAREGVAFRVNIGANDRADPRWLLPLICRRGGVTRREVGAIRIGPNETLFEIAGGAARDFALAASELDPRARHVVIERADGPSMDARSDAPPSERPALPSHAPEPHPRSHPPRPHQPPRAPEPPRSHQRPRAPERQHPRPPPSPRPHQPPRAPEPPRSHQPPRAPEPSRSHQPPRAPGPPRSHQPPRAPEPPRAQGPTEGGYHPLQRRVPRQHAPEQPRPYQQPRPHPPGKSHERPRPHAPGRSHERPHQLPRAAGGHGSPQRRSPEPPHGRAHQPSRPYPPGKPRKHRGPR